jgi:hypothetical protein
MEHYRFFDSVDGEDERSYTADEFAEYFRQLITSGIFNGGNNLQVICSGADMNISILPGYAWLEGYLYKIDVEPLALTLDAAHSELDRIDRVAIRLEKRLEHRYVRAFILKGTPAQTPDAPAITRDENTYELSLAQVRVIGGRSLVAQSEITDERLNTQVCGLANSLITADTTEIYSQFNDYLNSYKTTKNNEYNAWIADIQNAWDAWFAGQQIEGFLTGADKGAPGGVASLDGQGNVPLEQLGNIDITNIKKKFDSVEEGLLKNDLVEIRDGVVRRVNFENPFKAIANLDCYYKGASMVSTSYSSNLLIEALTEDTFIVHYLSYDNNLPTVRVGKWMPGEISPNNVEWGDALIYHTSAVTWQQFKKLANGDLILIALVGGVTTVYYLDINAANKTVSIGYSQSLNNGTNSNYAESAFIEDDRLLVVYTDIPNNSYVCGQVINIDTANKTFTVGGKYTLATETSTYPQIALDDNYQGVLAWRNSSNHLKAVPVTILGDVINIGTSYTVQTTAITYSIGAFYHNGRYYFVSEISSKPALSFHVLSISGNNIVVDSIKDTKPVARFQATYLSSKHYSFMTYGDNIYFTMCYTNDANNKSEILVSYDINSLDLNFTAPVSANGSSSKKSAGISILGDDVSVISNDGSYRLGLYKTKVTGKGQFNIFDFKGLHVSDGSGYGRIVSLSDERVAILSIGAREDNSLDNTYYTVFFYEYENGAWERVASYEFITNATSTSTYAIDFDERSIVVVFDGYASTGTTGYKRRIFFIRLNQDYSVYFAKNENAALSDDTTSAVGSLIKMQDGYLLFVYSKSGTAPINQKIYAQTIRIMNCDTSNPIISYGSETSKQLTTGAVYYLSASKVNDTTVVVIGSWSDPDAGQEQVNWLTINLNGTSMVFGGTGAIIKSSAFVSAPKGDYFKVLSVGNDRFVFFCRSSTLLVENTLIAGLGFVCDNGINVELKSLTSLLNGAAYYHPFSIYHENDVVYLSYTVSSATYSVAISIANDRLKLLWGNAILTSEIAQTSPGLLGPYHIEPIKIDGKLLVPLTGSYKNQYHFHGLLEIESPPTNPKDIIGLYRGNGEVAFSGYLDGFEGLVSGKDYYLKLEDLSISDKESVFKVGRALSETELLLCMEVL